MRAQDLRAIEPDAHAALAEERIVFFRNRQVGERFVAADIERANDERMLFADGLRDRFVGFELLVFARRAAALHEKKLRAQQADAFAAESCDLLRVLQSADIGDDFDAFAVERDRRLVRVREVFLALRSRPRLRAADARDFLGGGGFSRSVPLRHRERRCAVRNFERAGSMPASAGMPSERARMATCEVAPPRVVANPITRVRSSAAVSEGVRSSAMRIVFGGYSGAFVSSPVRIASTRRPTSRRSFARCASN